MNKWTHYICEECYQILEPGWSPFRVKDDIDNLIQACCKCGKMHSSGIYYRANPEDMLCKGAHD